MPTPPQTPPPTPDAFDPASLLAHAFARAIRAAFPTLDGALDPMVTASRAPTGKSPSAPTAGPAADFQCNAAMPLAKRVAMKPQDVARAIVAAAANDADLRTLAEPLTDASIAGPGFINLALKPDALANLLARLNDDAPGSRLGIAAPAKPQTIVVDLMGVNLAKQMHVGHLRSPIIGDALARLFARLGHAVIRQNHVGDWGLPIAMVTARLARTPNLNLNTLTLDALDTAYKAAQAECQRDSAALAAVHRYNLGPKALAECEEQVAGATEAFTHARQTLIDLQRKEPRTFAIWRALADVTMRECLAACQRLHVDVTDRDSAGESTYADELAPMVDDLITRGIATHSDGALIVELPELTRRDADGTELRSPCLIRKSDGGFLYATTDVAAVRRRVQSLRAHRVVYAIDARQSLHLQQVFLVAAKAGYATNPDTGQPASLEHAAFGSVLGEDGRPFKTRSGQSVKLADLLQETVERAQAKVREKSPDLPPDELARVAEAVGMAAIKYADLSTDRTRDYAFSFDRMLAFEGNTGPYLLYALVRIKSIFRKAADRGVPTTTGPITIADPAERTLALALLKYPATLRAAAETLEPHRVCQFLYEVAGAFASYFDRCPVLQADDPAIRDARLRLCALTARILEDGLAVLGIPTLDRM
jgi:arginyl-tRNA synthetase